MYEIVEKDGSMGDLPRIHICIGFVEGIVKKMVIQLDYRNFSKGIRTVHLLFSKVLVFLLVSCDFKNKG